MLAKTALQHNAIRPQLEARYGEAQRKSLFEAGGSW